MSVNEVRSLLHRRPFVPFRIVTSDGTVYQVPHPDLVFVSLAALVIGYPAPNQPEVADRFDIVSLRHVVRLEPRPEAVEQP
jgi:hypothetical protein